MKLNKSEYYKCPNITDIRVYSDFAIIDYFNNPDIIFR